MSQEQNAIGQTERMPKPPKKRVPLRSEVDLMRLTAEWTFATATGGGRREQKGVAVTR